MPLDAMQVRAEFPALGQKIGGQPLLYLDSAATTLRPRCVIAAMTEFMAGDNANPGRALHTLARMSYERLEGARSAVARFIGCTDPLEIVFTRGTTEAINLVAWAWCQANLHAGDEILLCIAEHASNMLPWQLAARRAGATVRYFGIDADGRMLLDDFERQLNPRTRLVAVSHVSNVLGMVNPVREIVERAHAAGALVLVDGAQSVPHMRVDVRDLGCDFLAFSSHKMLGPMGVGVLWARRHVLDVMPPFLSGSNMAHEITQDDAHYLEGALRFSAGTPDVCGPVGLAAAIELLERIGMNALREREEVLTSALLAALESLPRVQLVGSVDAHEKMSVVSFVVEGLEPAEVMRRLDASGVAVRAGDLASLPLLRHFGYETAVRASFYVYSTLEDVARFADALSAITQSTPIVSSA
jgi:cysteine desulfurase/selenocysteine lyase